MKIRYNFLRLVSLLLLFSSCTNSKSLFTENQNEWFVVGDADWNHEKKVLTGKLEKGTGFVMTNAEYDDFVLTMEFKPDSTINSGVFIRCKNKALSSSDCYEINIWDLNPNQDYRTGGVVMKSKPLNYLETINKWNNYKIKNVKQHLQVWINGVITTDIHDDSLQKGFIGLQAQGLGEIEFRNVRIKEFN